MGANLFMEVNGGKRPWDILIDECPKFHSSIREIAASTLLPESKTQAEDVWAALKTAHSVVGKIEMLNLGNQHGIWKLKSDNGNTKGKTTLMYLAASGFLSSKIIEAVPKYAWDEKDEKGRTYFDYLYEKWIASNGVSPKEINGLPKHVNIGAEKYARLVWNGMNYMKESCAVGDLILLVPPPLLRGGNNEYRDNFWQEFFRNDGAKRGLFKAVISVASSRYSYGKAEQVAVVYKEDYAIWRKSLQEARMKDGRRWVEAHKILADATIMMFLMENISYSKEQVGDISTDSKELRAKEWCNEISEVLLDLYSSGGRIDFALKRKDAICIEHKKEVDKLEKSDIFLLLNRRSRVERFNEDVINETQRMDVLLGAWLSYQEKFRLSTVIENQSNVDNRKHQQVL